nr:Chain F, LEU-THR-ARG-ASN-LYS-GLY-PRO [Homo sapiens]8JAL_S Chain S, LEU-THR-ARG-ASN-LYS-GLY-PRO [Homo sapiens]
TRGRLTRNKGP